MKLISTRQLYALITDAVCLIIGVCVRPLAYIMTTSGVTSCPVYKMGYVCPGCGGTRCVYNFVSGNFAKAFEFHPFLFCLIFYFAAIIITFNLDFLFDIKWAKKTKNFLTDYRLIITLAIGYTVFGIARNFF